MAFVDDPNNNSQNSTIAGAAPLSNAAPTDQASNTASEGSQAASQSSTIQSSSKPASTNVKAPKASSGMFTNIQKYVNKNKPSAQNMAESSVSDIRKTQDDLKQKQQDNLAKFTTNAQQGGLHDTQARVADVGSYTTEQANLPHQVEQTTTEGSVAAEQAQSQQTATGINEDRFSDIINANYTGPKNLTETGNLYQNSLEAANEAGRVSQMSQSIEGREQLLRDKFTQGGRQYTQGASQLDNLLLGQQTSQIAQMQDLGRQIGSTEDIMSRFTSGATDIANQTAGQVQATKDQARAEFQRVAQERQGQVDSRVGDVVENWDKLPAHFRAALSNPDGTVNLSSIEAGVLGVDSGEGLYNLTGEDLFGDGITDKVQADRSRLATINEQQNLARLQALSNLAHGGDKLYDINQSDYSDADLAGTQTAFDALDIEGVRNQLTNAEEAFRTDAAKNTIGTGVGNKYYDKDWGKTGRITTTRNVVDTLQNQLKDIYDFDSEINRDVQDNSKLLTALDTLAGSGNVVNTSAYNARGGQAIQQGDGLEDVVAAAENYGTMDDVSDNENSVVDDILNYNPFKGEHNFLGGGGLNSFEAMGDFVDKNTQKLSNGIEKALGDNAFTKAISAPVEWTGKLAEGIGSVIGDIGDFIGGSGKSDAKKIASAIAYQNANKDLVEKLQNKYKDSGFENRLGIQDNEQTQERTQQLIDLLSKLDKSNI